MQITAAMQQAKRGDTVQVHYRGTLDDGTDAGEALTFELELVAIQ